MTQAELTEIMKKALEESNKISHWNKEDEWYASNGVNWTDACKLKDRAIALFDVRWQSVKQVIDLIAEELGIANKGHYLYGPGIDDQHPIIDEIRKYVSRAGNKAEMKKKIAELENENAVLRSLVGK